MLSPLSRWPAVGALVAVVGCTSPTDLQSPELLEFHLEPVSYPSQEVPATARRIGDFLEIEGQVAYTGCHYLVPSVHGTRTDVRLELTLRETGGPCTLIPVPRRFTAKAGLVTSSGKIRIRATLRPAGTVVLDTIL
jgi:hypothetical protein